ncbi:MAG: pyridoxal phosphate-dependent aminotransferase [Planctomycetota bacterium]
MLAQRMNHIEGSGVRKIFELVATLEDPINLSIGQAHFEAPEEVKEAAIRAIREGANRYTVTEGLAELNRATLERLEKDHGHRPESILMTSGVSGGLLLSALALIDPGDEVLVPDPFFVMYKNVLALVGGKAVYYDTYPRGDGPRGDGPRGDGPASGGTRAAWHPDLDELQSLVSSKTKAILLNSPSNPTGGALSEKELDGIGEIARSQGAWIVSDEIYSSFVYERPHASMIPRMKRMDRCIVLGGFSKTYGVPGWRLGYAVGPRQVIDAMKLLQQYTFVCCPSPLQHGALAALDLDMSWIRAEYRQKRDRVVAGLEGCYELTPSEGSFYAFPSYPERVSEEDFVAACFERKLLIVPGSAFSRRATHFRLSFAAPDEMLDAGLAVLREIAAG